MIQAPPSTPGRCDGDVAHAYSSGTSHSPVPQFPPVLPQPPSQGERSFEGKWMSEAWQSVKGMERKWERLRQARENAVLSALDQATAVISEVIQLTFMIHFIML